MRIVPTICFAAVVCALTLGSATSYAQDQSQSGDSVAEAARKAREQKKNAPKPKHTLTDDDLAPRPAEPASTPSTSTAPDSAVLSQDDSSVSATAGATGSEKKEDPNSEAAWRKRFASVRKQLADAQAELDVLNREAQKADVQYYSDPQKALQEQYSRDEINKKNEKIAAKKEQIAALQQKLTDMEDDLRRAGGDPSWAR